MRNKRGRRPPFIFEPYDDLREATNFARHNRELDFEQIVGRMEEKAKEERSVIEAARIE